MVHSADDFRSHVARSAAGLFRVVLSSLPCHSEVSDPQVSIFLENQVLRLEISMNDPFRVDKLQTQDDTPYQKF